MGLIENDPRDTGYIALYIAIKWYMEITSDAALRIAQGRSHRLPGRTLTPAILQEIKKIMDSPNFYNINTVVKKYRINKYDIYAALAEEENKKKNLGGEVLVMQKADDGLKKAHEWIKNCEGNNCKNCSYDKTMFGDYTLCEIITDLEFEGKKLVCIDNKAMQKNAEKCINIKLDGKTKFRGFQVYESVLNEFDKLKEKHKGEKVKDLFSKVMLEGIKKLTRT